LVAGMPFTTRVIPPSAAAPKSAAGICRIMSQNSE
jgi:hypothetical protein